MKLARLRQQRRAARQVYPYGQRGSASELWYLHRDKLVRPEPEQRRVGFQIGVSGAKSPKDR